MTTTSPRTTCAECGGGYVSSPLPVPAPTLPIPAPTTASPSSSPTITPEIKVDVSMTITGFACSEYDTDLESVFETAMEDTWNSEKSSTAQVTADGCSNSTGTRRRRAMLGSTDTVDL